MPNCWKLIQACGLIILPLIVLSAAAVPAAGRVNAVATFPVLADFAAAVGGDLATVKSLVPFGGDPHNWEPTPQDAKMVADADVVFCNGLGLETWVSRLVENAATDRVMIITLSEGLPAFPYHGGDSVEDAHGHSHGTYDPHMWLDVTYAMEYVKRIAEVFGRLDPENSAVYRSRSEKYLEQLAELDQWLMGIAAQIPVENRRIITYHHAFGYFARRYGFIVDAYLVVNPDREPSAKDMMELTKLLASHPRRVMFTEPQVNIGLRYAEAAVKEVGGRLVALYTGSLTDSVPTYIDMMRHNGRALLEALQ
ncbi:MAG: metal ABC transporter substrate-binding protein [Limnochordia bacterium]|mgnify:CR=1 FL=1|jgi:ABC-type Zn uptake system ZnuABC Zn-binding protein ZnuA|nr:zinc ABC transporter substrate-binding protein [Bacillota bacterium]HOB09472.1 metal ABC transporter substrate-binding protein [Limnochordia bacterium]HPT92824.1 metal ABC transporter substrate-binding protein [Limnochordia bacterium]HPZ31483.1 metal ABC transporter substrate-binding protein [Limnochordia bacterium]HQD70969.1 metal ABC transporter substrate-binding protein [Limnochordia bacterium]